MQKEHKEWTRAKEEEEDDTGMSQAISFDSQWRETTAGNMKEE